MSNNGETPSVNEERRSDLAVMDEEEYKQKRRLERVLDAHDKVEEEDSDSMWMLATGEINQDARNIVLLQSVKEFIRELYNPLVDHAEATDGRDRYWLGYPDDPLGQIEFEHAENEVFVGLRDVLTANKVYSRTWTEIVERPQMMPQEETFSEDKTVPEGVSWTAFLRLKRFAEKERGLDLSYEPDDDGLPFLREFDQSGERTNGDLSRAEIGDPEI